MISCGACKYSRSHYGNQCWHPSNLSIHGEPLRSANAMRGYLGPCFAAAVLFEPHQSHAISTAQTPMSISPPSHEDPKMDTPTPIIPCPACDTPSPQPFCPDHAIFIPGPPLSRRARLLAKTAITLRKFT